MHNTLLQLRVPHLGSSWGLEIIASPLMPYEVVAPRKAQEALVSSHSFQAQRTSKLPFATLGDEKVELALA